MLATLLLSGFAVLIVITFVWWQAYRGAAERRPPQPSKDSIDERQKVIGSQLDAYKVQLDAYKTQADDLQRLISLLVGLSSFYAVVLGATSYLTAHQFIDRIKSDADRVERNVQALEKNYPVFTDFGANIDAGIQKLSDKFPSDEERDVYYTRLTENDKELILFFERSMVFLDYLDLPGKTARLYYGLGMFYSGRHSVEKLRLDSLENSGKIRIGTEWCLMDRRSLVREACVRACFYLQRAVDGDSSNSNFVARNDLGLALADLADLEDNSATKTVLLSRAESYFRDSYEIERCQQRALYNLARLLANRKEYDDAVEKLSEALNQTNWQTKPNPFRVKDIRYNRACYRCRLAEGASAHTHVPINEIKEDFKAWYKDGYSTNPVVRGENLKALKDDVKPGGDLAWLHGKAPDLIQNALKHLREGSA